MPVTKSPPSIYHLTLLSCAFLNESTQVRATRTCLSQLLALLNFPSRASSAYASSLPCTSAHQASLPHLVQLPGPQLVKQPAGASSLFARNSPWEGWPHPDVQDRRCGRTRTPDWHGDPVTDTTLQTSSLGVRSASFPVTVRRNICVQLGLRCRCTSLAGSRIAVCQHCMRLQLSNQVFETCRYSGSKDRRGLLNGSIWSWLKSWRGSWLTCWVERRSGGVA